MNRDDMVDAIIREVKRVLDLRGIDLASSDGTSTAQQPQMSQPAGQAIMPQPATTAAPPVPVSSVGIRDLSGKQVITARDLEQYKGQTITVTPKAVITPMAKDFAREKGITFVRSAGNPGSAGTPVSSGSCAAASAVSVPSVITVALAVARDFPGDSMMVKTFLAAKGFQVQDITGATYEAAVTSLSAAVSGGSAAFGVCIERTGMEGPIHANRNRGIRAVHCREVLDARAARVDIGANVIVLDAGSNPEGVIGGYIGL